MYALVDCNNFYASCERVFRPDLLRKPVVVLSNNDGCVIARSNEAKQLGIPMGAPAFEYDKLFCENKVQVFSANFPLYGDMSKRVMRILEEYSPDIEIYSIDEAFLRFRGFGPAKLRNCGLEMRSKVKRYTGIPVSVGMAPTKTLAKIANRIAKKYPAQTDNLYIIDNEEKRIKALRWLKIEDVWGIGAQHARRLKALHVYHAYEFTQLDDAWIRKHMSIVGLRMKYDLLGTPVLDMEELQVKKNIATTRSFEKNYTDFESLKERVSTFAVSCAEKLRKQHSSCSRIMVFLHTNGFRKEQPQYNKNIVVNLPYATNSSLELTQWAVMALKQIYKDGYLYKKAGVVVMELTPDEAHQTSLLENRNEKHIPLMQAMDKLNLIFGNHTVHLAVQDTERVWKMKQDHLSPAYTTRLSDIITIHT